MDSLLSARESISESILIHIDEEEIAMDIKIVHSILKNESYVHFLSPLLHNVTSAIGCYTELTSYENRITLIPEKNKPKQVNDYLCSYKNKNRRTDEI